MVRNEGEKIWKVNVKIGEEKMKAILLTSEIEKMIGMFGFPLPLVFLNSKERFTSVHSFFIFREFYIAFFNENWRIIKIVRMKPFSIVREKCLGFLELESVEKIKKGDKVEICLGGE